MKHYCTLLVILSIFVTAVQTALSNDATAKPIRVLIVDDQSPGYFPMVGTASAIRNILREDKQFEAVLVEDAEILGTDLPFDYDVIFMHFKNDKTPKRNTAMQANLEKFVTEGGGLIVYHYACGAFGDWEGYEHLAGRIYDPNKKAHDPYGWFTVQIIDKTHPITAGIGNFRIQDELYTCLNDSKVPVRMLAEAVSIVDGKKQPMAFVLEKGKGRTFHTPLGHDSRSLSSKEFQTMLKQAIVWCAKR